MFLPCGEFLPDMPDFQNPGISEAHNVFPRTPKSYGPIAAFSANGTPALDGAVIGALAAVDSSDNVDLFAGTADNLYQLTAGATSFNNVSISGGYTTSAGDDWHFVNFNGLVLATNFANPIQGYTLGSSTLFSNLASAAPQARYIAAVKGFCMVGNTYDATNGYKPQRIWWSAVGDPTTWPTPGSVTAAQLQSDYQDIPGDQGEIQALVANLGNADGAVFFERAVYRLTYVGSPVIFTVTQVEGLRGTPAPRSVVQLGAFCFYLGEDGFYLFDGANSTPIGANKVDKYFYSRLNQAFTYLVTAAVDPINRVVMWAYPGPTSTNGALTDVIMFNWSINRWSDCDFSGEYLLRAITTGYSMEGLDTPSGGNLDALQYSLDSQIWSGGSIIMGAFNLNHQFGYLNGANLAPTVETSEVEMFPSGMLPTGQMVAGARAFVRSAKPIVDGGSPSVAIALKNRAMDAQVYGSPSLVNSMGECPLRGEGRYVRARMTLPAGSTYTNISGVDLDATKAGWR